MSELTRCIQLQQCIAPFLFFAILVFLHCLWFRRPDIRLQFIKKGTFMNMVHSELWIFTIVLVVHWYLHCDWGIALLFPNSFSSQITVIKQIFIHGSSILTNYNNLDVHVFIRWDDPQVSILRVKWKRGEGRWSWRKDCFTLMFWMNKGVILLVL